MSNNKLYSNIGIFPLPFKDYWQWLNNIPLSLKWFTLIILFKPIIDAFYFVKSSGVISPSQLVGFLTFLLSTYYIISKRQKDKLSLQMFIFLIFTFLLFLNSFLVYLVDISIIGIGEFIRVVLPIFILFYLKNEIRNLDDLNGLLLTYLISSVIPYFIFLYEYIFAPIQIVEISEGRGGGIRLTGIYADMFNYMSYIIGVFLICLLYFTNKVYIKSRTSFAFLIGIFCLTIVGLVGIKHQASWGVFFTIILIFLISIASNQKGKMTILTIAIISLFVLPVIWENTIAPLYSKEIRAYNDEKYQQTALNGRINRWKKYFAIWEKMPTECKIFGVGFSNHKSVENMMSGGMHSDYVRFLFSTGILGLLCYVTTLILILLKSFLFPTPVRFFVLSCCAIFLLYAISANPFGASGALMYLGILGLTMVEKPIHFFTE